MIGVFIATNVTNWNDARITREKARVVNARLLADVRAEALSFKYLIHYYREVLANAEAAAAAIEGTAPLADEPFLIAAYRSTKYRYYTASRAAISSRERGSRTEIVVANRAKPTEHAGAKKGRGAYYGPKREAKRGSDKRRRRNDKEAARETDSERDRS